MTHPLGLSGRARGVVHNGGIESLHVATIECSGKLTDYREVIPWRIATADGESGPKHLITACKLDYL